MAKSTPTNPNKEQIVFVLIHQKTGFVNAKLHHIRNTKFWITQKKEMGNMRSVGTQNVKSSSMRRAAKPEKVSRILRQEHKRKEERKKTEIRESNIWYIKHKDLNEMVLGTSRNFYSYHKMHTKWHFCWLRTHGSSCLIQKSTWIDS